ncbi:MAG: hypothetical protein ACTSRE_12110 [Promethearchaeota archaeon]
MANIYLIMSLELGHIILMSIILFLKVKKFLKERNILDFAIMWVLFLTAGLVVYNAYLNVAFALGRPDSQIYLGNWELGSFIGIMASAPYCWFLLNLIEAKKIYTLPFVATFYVEVYGFFESTPLFHQIYIVALFIPGSIALLVYAIKRKHGLSFAIGLSVVMFLFTDTFISPNLIAIYYSLEYVVMIVLLLGVTGWWDSKVFYDRNYRAEISTSWIAGRIGSKA